MNRVSRLALLSLACVGSSACTSRDDASAPPGPGAGPAEVLAVAAEQCQMVTSIEVVHRVNGSPVTDLLRLTNEAGEDAVLALRSFQIAANHFGAANVVSSRPISQVQCFSQTTATSKPIAERVALASTSSLCVDWNGVLDCSPVTPSHTYDYTGTETCSVTNYTDAVSFSCTDSNAIITKHGEARV